MRFTKIIISTLLLAGGISFPVWAGTPPVLLDIQQIERAIQQAAQAQQTPLEKYREQLLALQPAENQDTPTVQELLPILHGLVAYNMQLSSSRKWEEQLHDLAEDINRPVRVYWNTFRGNSFIEILDAYIPDNHGDKLLAKLEYLVKRNLQSAEEVEQIKTLNKTLPVSFAGAYNQLKFDLADLSTRDTATILRHLVPVAQEYNKLYRAQDARALALQLHEAYFRQPLRTGFDRVISIEEIRYTYGLYQEENESYIKLLPAQELVARYNLTQEEAETLGEFFAHYYR